CLRDARPGPPRARAVQRHAGRAGAGLGGGSISRIRDASGRGPAPAGPAAIAGGFMIRFQAFGKRFGNVTAVEALDLSVAPGNTVALIGPNGSGKTTTLKALMGLVRPSSGRITVDGHDASGGPEARARLGYLPQRITFPEGSTARGVLAFHARLR